MSRGKHWLNEYQDVIRFIRDEGAVSPLNTIEEELDRSWGSSSSIVSKLEEAGVVDKTALKGDKWRKKQATLKGMDVEKEVSDSNRANALEGEDVSYILQALAGETQISNEDLRQFKMELGFEEPGLFALLTDDDTRYIVEAVDQPVSQVRLGRDLRFIDDVDEKLSTLEKEGVLVKENNSKYSSKVRPGPRYDQAIDLITKSRSLSNEELSPGTNYDSIFEDRKMDSMSYVTEQNDEEELERWLLTDPIYDEVSGRDTGVSNSPEWLFEADSSNGKTVVKVPEFSDMQVNEPDSPEEDSFYGYEPFHFETKSLGVDGEVLWVTNGDKTYVSDVGSVDLDEGYAYVEHDGKSRVSGIPSAEILAAAESEKTLKQKYSGN